MKRKILLDPIDFDALHLSMLAFGGVGHGPVYEYNTGGYKGPWCVLGHAADLDFSMAMRLHDEGLKAASTSDRELIAARIPQGEKIPFGRYIRILNIDVKETENDQS